MSYQRLPLITTIERPPLKSNLLVKLEKLSFHLHLVCILFLVASQTIKATGKHVIRGKGIKKSWTLSVSFCHALCHSLFKHSSPQSIHFDKLARLLTSLQTPKLFYFKSILKDDYVTINGSRNLASLVRKGLGIEPNLPVLSLDPDSRYIHGEWTIPKSNTSSKIKLVFYLHGGGHVSMSHVTHRTITQGIANKLACPVFLPNYRLSPRNPFPSAVEDVLATYSALVGYEFQGVQVGLGDASSFQVKPSEIVFIGDSAGGALIMQLLKCIKGLSIPMPRKVILISPYLDHSMSHDSWRRNYESCIMGICTEGLRYQMYHYASGLSLTHPALTPLTGKESDLDQYPPILIQAGESETIVDDSIVFFEKYSSGRHQISIQLELFKDMFHVFHIFPFIKQSQIAMQRIQQFCLSDASDDDDAIVGKSRSMIIDEHGEELDLSFD